MSKESALFILISFIIVFLIYYFKEVSKIRPRTEEESKSSVSSGGTFSIDFSIRNNDGKDKTLV